MARKIADRVRETSTTTGTAAFALQGAAAGYRTFSAVAASGDTVPYCIQGQTSTEWEVGIGTMSGTGTMTRTTVLANSAGTTSRISFAAGTKDIFLTAPAARLPLTDVTNTFSAQQVISDATAAPNPYGGALVIAGGIGVAQNISAGSRIDASDQIWSGEGLLTSGWVEADGDISTHSTTASTSTTTGALKVAGGAGVVGNLNVGGSVNLTSTAQATSTASGALVTAGGVGIAKDLRIGGTVVATGSVTAGDFVAIRAASPGTGALFLGNSGVRYLFYNGTGMELAAGTGLTLSGNLSVSGNASASGTISTPGVTLLSSAGNALALNGHQWDGTNYTLGIWSGSPAWNSMGYQALHVPGNFVSHRFYLFNGSTYILYDLRHDGQAMKPGGGSWGDVSDERFKDNIVPFSRGLSAVLLIDPVEYCFKVETKRDPVRRYIGGLAQNVEQAVPEMVTTAPATLGDIHLDDARTLDPSALPWVLVNAVKELAAQNTALAARVAALEGNP